MLIRGYIGLLFIIATAWISKVQTQNFQNPNYWINDAKRTIKEYISTVNNNGTAKNIVLIMADGLDLDVLTAYRIGLGEDETPWNQYTHFGMAKTYCVDQQTPDPACAAAAVLTGIKTKKDLVGVNARATAGKCSSTPKRRMTSILDWAAAAGKRTGIVTTSRITAPTVSPAYAHSASSAWEGDVDIEADKENALPCKDIARQLVEGKTNGRFNVLFGGGRKYFLSNSTVDPVTNTIDPSQRNDGVDPIQVWMYDKIAKNATNAVVYQRDTMEDISSSTEYALGLFNPDTLPDAKDISSSSPEPTLGEMVSKAVSILEQGSDGYVLLIETSKIARNLELGLVNNALLEVAEIKDVVDSLTLDSETLLITAGLRGSNMKLTGQQPLGSDPRGQSADTTDMASDGLDRTSIQMATGPGYASPRSEGADTLSNDTASYPSCVPQNVGDLGPQDVPVWAVGPMSYLFKNVHEQNYIAHAASYAMCKGLYKRCVKK